MDATNKALAADYPVTQIVWAFFLGFALAAVARAAREGGIVASMRTRRPGLQLLRAVLLPKNMACVDPAPGLLPIGEVKADGIVSPLVVPVVLGWGTKGQ